MEALDLTRIESVQTGHTLAGIHYDLELAGPGGCHITLFPTEQDTSESIRKAKEVAEYEHDVVAITIRRIRTEDLPPEFQPKPDYSDKAGSWLEAVRWIVEHKAFRRIDVESGQLVPDNKRGGTLVDLFSASAMIQVYEALSEANRAKLAAMSLPVAHHVVFKVLNKAKA